MNEFDKEEHTEDIYFGCWGHVPINCYFKLVK